MAISETTIAYRSYSFRYSSTTQVINCSVDPAVNGICHFSGLSSNRVELEGWRTPISRGRRRKISASLVRDAML